MPQSHCDNQLTKIRTLRDGRAVFDTTVQVANNVEIATSDRLRWLYTVALPIAAIVVLALILEAALGRSGAQAIGSLSPVAEASPVAHDSAPSPDDDDDDSHDQPVTVEGIDCADGSTTGNTIAVRARGTTGDEAVTLVVVDPDGYAERTVVPVTTDFNVFAYSIPSAGFYQSIRVEFSNDRYRVGGYDRNVVVDWVEVCGYRLQTEDSSTESFGVWSPASGCRNIAYGAGETLHCNGYFEFGGTQAEPSMIAVTTTARGTSGEEILDIDVNGEIVESFRLSNRWEDYTFMVPRETSVSQIRFEFNNDKYIRGVVDRNLIIQKIVFDDRIIETLDNRTFVAGFYDHGRCQSGNNIDLQTTIIHCNGSFTFEQGPSSLSR